MQDPTETRPVVYDLDGTLVRLPVDWGAAAEDAAEALRDAGVDPDGTDLWGLLELASETGTVDAFEAAVGAHEREAARESARLPLANELAESTGPVGVCSLNCEAACREALAVHGLTDRVDAVIGRDSVATHKPDPEPLLATLSAMGVEPASAEFVGDSERDEVAARRAGVSFRWVE
ncbi:MAG: HAD hydrolase-like protein [Halolamina sp.]|uniref:HAD family hydrolase n=1 Tax=Halolamina sp. TaxID=1940283 RepID=UPI002FC39159